MIPLTVAQQRAVDALVAGGRLAVVPADLGRAGMFVRHARNNLAYDACHDLGEALLAGYGYRTCNGSGQHEALGRFLRAVIDSPPGDREARRY